MVRQRRKTVEEVLRADPHIKDIIATGKIDVPEVDPNLWVPERREKMTANLRLFGGFLAQPLILDDFGQDHDARIEWREKMEGRHKGFHPYWSSNALKYNNLVGIRWCIYGTGKGYCGTSPGQLEGKNSAAIKAIPDNDEYRNMSEEERVKAVVEAKDKVRDLLEFLSKQKPLAP